MRSVELWPFVRCSELATNHLGPKQNCEVSVKKFFWLFKLQINIKLQRALKKAINYNTIANLKLVFKFFCKNCPFIKLVNIVPVLCTVCKLNSIQSITCYGFEL